MSDRAKFWIRILIFGIILSFIIFFITGCSQPISKGTIYEKEFTPAHTATVMVPHTMKVGKTFVTYMTPITSHHSDTYAVFIEQMVEGERLTARYEVSKDFYDSVEIGQIINFAEVR